MGHANDRGARKHRTLHTRNHTSKDGRNTAISIVIPVYNEEENLPSLYEGLKEVLDQMDESWELVFVDDGSQDGSFGLLATTCELDSCVKVVQLRRNFGQTPALAAGLDHARGDVMVTLDADLQYDPADISRLLAKLDQGYDCWQPAKVGHFETREIRDRERAW